MKTKTIILNLTLNEEESNVSVIIDDVILDSKDIILSKVLLYNIHLKIYELIEAE